MLFVERGLGGVGEYFGILWVWFVCVLVSFVFLRILLVIGMRN